MEMGKGKKEEGVTERREGRWRRRKYGEKKTYVRSKKERR